MSDQPKMGYWRVQWTENKTDPWEHEKMKLGKIETKLIIDP